MLDNDSCGCHLSWEHHEQFMLAGTRAVSVVGAAPIVVYVAFIPSNPVVALATMSDGTEVELFAFYSDELRFSAEELLGLTTEQCSALWFKKDQAYLAS